MNNPPLQNESEELRKFREEWRAEVKRRNGVESVTRSESTEASDWPDTASFNVFSTSSGPASSGYATSVATVPPTPSASFHVSTAPPLSQVSSLAVSIYREAVIHEQRGELEEALYLYRSAFRRDANVDILFEREEMLGAIMAQQIAPKLENTLAMQNTKAAVSPAEHGVTTSRNLNSILNNFPPDLVFEPEDEEDSVPINLLPDEMIVYILKILDASSLERFASVNRKARVVSLDVSIWRKLAKETYKPPQIPVLPDGSSSLEYLSKQYLYDYRRLYIEHPRIRLDGVYIAVCHYIRPGLSENSWVNVNHLITYHRYLRFFPNGQVISLLTNEEQPPAHVIPLLKPTLRGLKGLLFGNWHLSGNTVVLSNLIDASSRSLTHGHGHGHAVDPSIPTVRYIFTMHLTLLSRPLGRWNKMDIVSYDTVKLETGEASPVALKHERPFWFSKVRSYALS
ncbi:hypothetical protein EV359DRAFT_35802 [Lentinula novae-zelandiae]|nr:hypothetical protein EV359DRAFT_35802 [Lentinula novae-zelandiae]